MITLIFSIWKFTFTLDLEWVFTKWYLPIHPSRHRGYSHGEFQVLILWFIFISIKIPMKSSAKEAMKYLPNAYRG